jgi:hypothetical protein
MQGINKACEADYCSTMLVVVEDRNIAEFFELLFDIETIGCLDVLQVYASERARKQFYTFDEIVRVLGVDRKVD